MENIMDKTCTKCLITKNVTEFYFTNKKPIAACKECSRRASKNYAVRAGKIKGNYGRSRFEALIGQVINDWTVVGSELIKGKNTRVKCRCKCGKEQLVSCIRLEQQVARGCRTCYPVHGSKSHLFKGVGEIPITYLRKIKEQAAARNISVDVTADELWQLFLSQGRKCALTGLEINFGKHVHKKETKMQSKTASLDRIDSEKGYTLDNLQWVHKHVNIMKNRYDNTYFKQICEMVTKHANRN